MNVKHRLHAFSLIELMIVLGIVGLLLAFAAPNLFSLINANSLSGEGTLLRNQFTYAQQLAVSKSADVEVRFFHMDAPEEAMTEKAYRAYQLFQYNTDGELVPISQFFRIRPPVQINERLSSLLKESSGTAEDEKYGFISPRRDTGQAPIGEGGEMVSTSYMAFRFRPDGSTDLPNRSSGSDTWYLTLVQGEGAASSDRPDNYFCLQVNPYNGQISEFRP